MECLTALLETISAKLGVGIDVLWTALMRQAFISSLCDIVWAAIVLALGILITKYGRIVHKKTSNADWDNIAWFPFFLAAFSYFIIAILTTLHMDVTIAGFINPEYWALTRIIK